MTERITHVSQLLNRGHLVDVNKIDKSNIPSVWISTDMGRKGPGVAHDLQTVLHIERQLPIESPHIIGCIIPQGLVADQLWYYLNGLDSQKIKTVLNSLNLDDGTNFLEIFKRRDLDLLISPAEAVYISNGSHEKTISLEQYLVAQSIKIISQILSKLGSKSSVSYINAIELFSLNDYANKVVNLGKMKSTLEKFTNLWKQDPLKILESVREVRKGCINWMRLEGLEEAEIPYYNGEAMFRLLHRVPELQAGLALQELNGDRDHSVLESLSWAKEPIKTILTPDSHKQPLYNASVLALVDNKKTVSYNHTNEKFLSPSNYD